MNITNKIVRTAMVVIVSIAWTSSLKAQGTLMPVYLRCEDRVNPLGIGNPTPELSWQLQGTGQGMAYRGQTQSAYEIVVGSTPGSTDLWDSGKVLSSQISGLLYSGTTLISGEQCYWQVRVYDGDGNVSAWSAPAQWTMGLLSPTNWTAQWIGYDAAYNLTPQQSNNAALFNTSGLNWLSYSGQTPQGGLYQSSLRKTIVLPVGQTITNSIMALYADNSCGVFANGQPTTNAAMRWEATAEINVTSWLHGGTNLLALAATNTDQPASAIGRLIVQFASGSVSNIPVDTSWKAAQWPAGNWTATNYNDSAWTTPGSGGTPWGTPALNDIARVPAPYLRKNFAITQAVTRATVYVTALGAYELHLNGNKVGNDVLTPGWTQFTKRVYYQTYDVTSLLQQGTNTIGAILGDGWYASDLAYKGQRLNYGGTPRFLAQMIIQFSDGSTQTVVTDGSWQASYGPILYGDLLIGSGYDARQEMPGWDATNFNASAWPPVEVGLNPVAVGYSNVTAIVIGLETNNQVSFVANNATMGGDPAFGIVKTLQITFQIGGGTNQTQSFAENSTVNISGNGQTLTIIQALYGDSMRFPGNGGLQVQAAVTEPSRCFEMLAATNLTQPAPGCYTFDLGQNIAGWAQLNISGHVGDRITIRYGEMLNPNGTVYTENLRGAAATDFYTFATNGSVVYQPHFTFHGFRYVELRGLSVPPTINSMTGIVVHSDIPLTGSFSCSSALLNQLYSNITWGQKGNYLEVPTDCPQRDERMGWTGDTEFFTPTAVYNFDVQSFFRRHLVTLCEDAQHSDGSFANVAPDLGAGSGAAAWGDAAWICTDVMYRTYGDTNVIVDHYAAFQTYGQYLAAHATNFTVPSLPGDYNDWLNLGGGASETVIDTAFYAYYAQAMSEMAAAIGKSGDAGSYATLHSNIVAAFATFFNSDGSFKDGSSQTGYALGFTLNLVPSALQSQAERQFADTIAQFDNHLATGFIGTPRLLPALHNIGRDDLAYTLLLQQTYPSWLYQVLLGATTMWERWDGWTPSAGFQSATMNSFNHYAFGSVGQYLYGEIGGINPASPGYKTILIKPVPGTGLNWASTSYNSVNGTISTAWTNIGGNFNLEVMVPPNTMAQICVPATNATSVTESGVPASTSPGVTYVGFSNNYAIYSVGSGNYKWTSILPTPPPPPTVTESDAVYQIGSSFPPLPQNDLITNAATSVAANTLAFGPENHAAIIALHDGAIGSPGTTNLGCEISGGMITFYLGPGANGTGYTITNLETYTSWQDDGRENANYAINYSPDGTNFSTLATVAYNPSPYPTKDGTGGTWTSLAVANLTGVRYLQWNFSASQQNGGVGYTELAAFGPPSSLPAPVISSAVATGSGSLVVSASGLVPGQGYQLQSTTNLASPVWVIETNFMATQPVASITNSTVNAPQKFFRMMGN